MKPFMRTIIMIVFSAIGIALIAASLATAAYMPENPMSQSHPDMAAMMAPVEGDFLFEEQEGGEICFGADNVLASFRADQRFVGGEVIHLGEIAGQMLSDNWRVSSGAVSSPVSAIVVHLFSMDGAGDMADVAEIGASGCAISRTLLSRDQWDLLSGMMTVG